MAKIELSKVHPDAEQIKAQLINALSGYDAWNDPLDSGVGEFLVDAIAAVGEYDQFSIEQSPLEAFQQTARRKSSIYACMQELGVRLVRKTPSKIDVKIKRKEASSDYIIQPMSVFSSGDASLFNREAITIPAGQLEINVTLYEGKIQERSLTATGDSFQEFVSTESQFYVSDSDVFVYYSGALIPVVTDGLWFYKGQKVVNDSTTKDGQLLLRFGDSQFGFKPRANSSISIVYVVTLGASVNNSNALLGKTIKLQSDSNITCETLSSFYGGTNELSASTYKKYGAGFYSADRRANKPFDFVAKALEYPSIKDIVVVGQQKLSPTDNRYMNLVRLSPIGENGPLSAKEKQAFLAWYQQRTTYPCRFYFLDPTPSVIDIEATIWVRRGYDLDTVRSDVIAALNGLFLPRAGYMETPLYKSDIYDAISSASAGVDFINLVSPSIDASAPNLSVLFGLQLTENKNAGTSLAAGTYTYGVSLINESNTGQTLINEYSQITIEAGSSITITLPNTSNISGYQVFGRGPTAPLKLISTVGPTITSYTDTGAVTPTVNEPEVDTSGVFYLIPGNVTLNMAYSRR